MTDITTAAIPITLHSLAPFSRQGGRGNQSPMPPRPVIMAMLADLTQQLDTLGYIPTGIICRSWREEFGATARISLTAFPGDMPRSLASWYEWQHPKWDWLVDVPPAVDIARARDLRAALAAIAGEAAHA